MSEDGSKSCLTKSGMRQSRAQLKHTPWTTVLLVGVHPTGNGAFGLWFLADTEIKVFTVILSSSLHFYTSFACLHPLPPPSLVPPSIMRSLPPKRNRANCQAKSLLEFLARSMLTLFPLDSLDPQVGQLCCLVQPIASKHQIPSCACMHAVHMHVPVYAHMCECVRVYSMPDLRHRLLG